MEPSMKIRYLHINDDFGFISLQTEKPEMCWFIHSKAQGRSALDKADDGLEKRECLADLENSPLPENSESAPCRLEGRVCETLSWLMSPIAKLSQAGRVLVDPGRKGKPSLFFLLEPRKEDVDHNPTGLIGLQDNEGNRTVYVFYSRKQGRGILQLHCSQMDIERVSLAHGRMNNIFLPEESPLVQVRIGDPMATFLRHGYYLAKYAGL